MLLSQWYLQVGLFFISVTEQEWAEASSKFMLFKLPCCICFGIILSEDEWQSFQETQKKMSYQIIISQEFKMRMAKAIPTEEQPKILLLECQPLVCMHSNSAPTISTWVAEGVNPSQLWAWSLQVKKDLASLTAPTNCNLLLKIWCFLKASQPLNTTWNF